MKGIEAKPIRVTAFYVKDKTAGTFTIYNSEPGGPIITAASLEEAKELFSEALKLGFAVRNLYYFAEVVKADNEQKAELAKNIGKTNPEIEYAQATIDELGQY